MSKTPWTPGPWSIDGENAKVRRVIKGGGSKPRTVCIIESWTTEADAGLIAAAPDLYETLNEAAELLIRNAARMPADAVHVVARIGAALAKARGES